MGLSLTVHEALASEAELLSTLHRQVLPPGWSSRDFELYIQSQTAIVFKAQTSSHLIGCAIVQVAADEAELLTLAVDQTFQRQGCGRILLTHVLKRAKLQNAKQMYLEVGLNNCAALSLYQAVGFKEVARRYNYYAINRTEQETAIVMKADIC